MFIEFPWRDEYWVKGPFSFSSARVPWCTESVIQPARPANGLSLWIPPPPNSVFPETLWGQSWPPPICHPSSCLFLPLPDENPLVRKLSQINTRPLISYHLLPNAAQLYFINMCIVWAELNQTIISTSLRLRLNYRIIEYPSSKEFFFKVLPNHLVFQIKINQN